MMAHVSRWVLPVSLPPIQDGAVLVAGDRIQAVGLAREVLAGFNGQVCDHGDGAILPGLVNCHAHLEFSALAGRVPPQERWEDWLTATLAGFAVLTQDDMEKGIHRGIQALRDHGTILVGEVSNTGASWPHLETSPLAYHLFYECLGFDLWDLGNLEEAFPFFALEAVSKAPWVSAAAHAPYSVSPALFRAIRGWNTARRRPQTVHLSESQAEGDFLARGGGFLKDLLQTRGRGLEGFQPPGLSPTAYLDSLGFLGPGTLAVHGVWLEPADCNLLAHTQTWLVICPRANRYTGAGTPPIAELLRAGVPLALGTDSLAGNWDLNLFGEMRWLYENFPEYPPDLWLRLGTINGAQALGRQNDFGSLEPGKNAALGYLPLANSGDFWGKLYTTGAAGEFCWIG